MASAAAFLLLASTVTLQPTDSAGVLLEGAVRIVLYPSYARVISLYTVERNGTELRFDAMRAPGQLVLVDQVTGQGLEENPRQLIERRRLTALSGPRGEATYRIVYSVSGDLARLPLFVPNTRVDLDRTQLHIEVIGRADGIEIPAAEPEFHVTEEGLLVARPPALPPFVTLPRPRRGEPHSRRVGWVVLSVALALTFVVLYRARTSRRSAGSEASEGSPS